MKYSYLLGIAIAAFFIAAGCNPSNKHFISDEDYRNMVEEEFKEVKVLAQGRSEELFSIFEKDLSLEETEALKFLYAFMPLNDLANNDGNFYLNNVRLAFKTRDLFQWGNNIPEDVFRHFVLPHRINNEDSDTARAVFLRELTPRIKDMDIETAALEVNHWCHEKVNYQPTDSRTMSPLGVIRTAYGRCGEESTFTVTAMRSVGIPARQVYTPRWAHSDDNHAWVEVYINGEWKYLGACEPEAVLNKGWFDGPVLRAMMVHTKAFGQYKGDEKVLGKYDKYSVLNLLSNYGPTKDFTVLVKREDGTVNANAYVEIGLYNYAEFYPLKSGKVDEQGLFSINTGYGDLRIFVSDTSGSFAIEKVSVENVDTIILQCNLKTGLDIDFTLDNIPPIDKVAKVVDPGQQELNKKRLAQEDSIRNQFVATFYNDSTATFYANTNFYEDKILRNILPHSRGNYPVIKHYLEQNHEKKYSLELLGVISEKDLHDITLPVLNDHLNNLRIRSKDYSEEIIINYILNPRVQLEQITAYRAYLSFEFTCLNDESILNGVQKFVEFIKTEIKVDNAANYYHIPLSPQGVHQLKVSDDKSRNIFFVSVLRSVGIPARIEQATSTPQFYNDGWISVNFDAEEQFIPEKAFLNITKSADMIISPAYRVHFGLAKYDGQKFNTLDYGWDKKLEEFPEIIEVEPGYYQLTTGNRLSDGSVLVDLKYFQIKEEESRNIEIKLRKRQSAQKAIAKWENAPNDSTAMIFGWIDPKSEPGKHFLNDLRTIKSTYDKAELPVHLFVADQKEIEALALELPNGFLVELDKDYSLLQKMYQNSSLNKDLELPVLVILNAKGDIMFLTSGYKIGTPEQLLKVWGRVN